MTTDLGGPVPFPAEPGGRGRFPGEPVLSIRDLSVAYRTVAGDVRAVDRVSLDLHAGEVSAWLARVARESPRLPTVPPGCCGRPR